MNVLFLTTLPTLKTCNSPYMRIMFQILSNANDDRDHLCSQLKILVDKRINKKFTMSKQQFWRLKKTLVPKSISIPHSVMSSFGNEVTDPENEFQYRLRIREP